MDGFPKFTGTPGPPPAGDTTTGLVMGYYDGNTVTALWNYAQQFAMNDNSYGTTFGPSTPGAINLVSGQTGGVDDAINVGNDVVPDGGGGLTLVSDADPVGDVSIELIALRTGTEHRRSAESRRCDLGLLRGWIQPADEECGRLDGLRPHDDVDGYEHKEG